VNPPAQLLLLARKAATAQSLDPCLVCAVIEQESAWNPWAIRYEPAFFSKYVAPLYTNNKISATEAYARGFSWGLMQVMGQVARENDFDALFLVALCDPEQALTIDCKACQAKLSTAQSDLTDERLKTTALTRERDDALRIARGGSLIRRITRVAKWLLIGAAAGAVAAKAAH